MIRDWEIWTVTGYFDDREISEEFRPNHYRDPEASARKYYEAMKNVIWLIKLWKHTESRTERDLIEEYRDPEDEHAKDVMEIEADLEADERDSALPTSPPFMPQSYGGCSCTCHTW